ncbi:hypothetical protein F383_08897 [Gossypium arboreum]|uniref:Uncharacterized protein n=1 Tax=Gossypium arboreum TaxID=29729 RepID=A0A0B0PI33_GOSAR|nr:hypothetical protein F383_08897 [Gossypium arboreum]
MCVLRQTWVSVTPTRKRKGLNS